jgi:hypothetical protein
MKFPVQLVFGGSDEFNGDFSWIHECATANDTSTWAALKHTRKGDRFLIYFNQPHSAIIASAVVLKDAYPASDRPFRTRIGKIRILQDPITFDELHTLLPGWEWLKYPRSKVYLEPKAAALLWKRAEGQRSSRYQKWRDNGAGFGIAEDNKKTEKAAIRRVKRSLQGKGYTVTSREAERIGYDLDARKRDKILHVEVKGVSGSLPQFVITAGEFNRSKEDPNFHLYVVTGAKSRSARIHPYTGRKLQRTFQFTPLSYTALAKK